MVSHLDIDDIVAGQSTCSSKSFQVFVLVKVLSPGTSRRQAEKLTTSFQHAPQPGLEVSKSNLNPQLYLLQCRSFGMASDSSCLDCKNNGRNEGLRFWIPDSGEEPSKSRMEGLRLQELV